MTMTKDTETSSANRQEFTSHVNAMMGEGRYSDVVRTILGFTQTNPMDVSLLNTLGLAYQNLGQVQEAMSCFEQGIAQAPQFAELHNNLGFLLQKTGHWSESIIPLSRACELKPEYSKALLNRGRSFLALQNWEAASKDFQAALSLQSNNQEALHGLGLIAFEQQRYQEALNYLQEAINIQPGTAWASYELIGRLLMMTKDFERASQAIQTAIQLNPNFTSAYLSLATLCRQVGNPNMALASLNKARELAPNHAMTYLNIAQVMNDQRQWDQALKALDIAQQLGLNDAQYYLDRGIALASLSQNNDARKAFEQSMSINPDYRGVAYWNIALIDKREDRIDEAISGFEKALEYGYNTWQCESNIGYLHMLMGRFQEGWHRYEDRLKNAKEYTRQITLPRWDGTASLKGKRLLIISEQGFGDTIMMARYFPKLTEMGAEVLLECHPELMTLMAGTPGISELLPKIYPGQTVSDDRESRVDTYCYLMSLPGLMGTTLDTIPSAKGILSIPEDKKAQWKDKLSTYDGLKIGLVWHSRDAHKTTPMRSCALAEFAPLAKLKGVHLFSFQKGPQADQINQVDFPVIDLGSQVEDFTDTAALVEQLDMVIAIDTALIHLAATLDKPTWALICADPEWRWMMDRTDNPWYPSVRVFRQQQMGEWAPVFKQVTTELKTLLAPAKKGSAKKAGAAGKPSGDGGPAKNKPKSAKKSKKK